MHLCRWLRLVGFWLLNLPLLFLLLGRLCDSVFGEQSGLSLYLFSSANTPLFWLLLPPRFTAISGITLGDVALFKVVRPACICRSARFVSVNNSSAGKDDRATCAVSAKSRMFVIIFSTSNWTELLKIKDISRNTLASSFFRQCQPDLLIRSSTSCISPSTTPSA